VLDRKPIKKGERGMKMKEYGLQIIKIEEERKESLWDEKVRRQSKTS
jgi:hypothetical protein